MDLKDKLLFEQDQPVELGIGFHNIGSGVLRYANEDIKQEVETFYAQRCGHLPMNAKTLAILLNEPTTAAQSQIGYLSELYGREIRVITPEELKKLKTKPVIVPYISVPEAEETFSDIDAYTWGLPGKLTHILKNKYEFHRLADQLNIEGFRVPDYTKTSLTELIPHTKTFLKQIETMYADAGMKNQYPLGVMLRAADEDGNYGSSLMHEKGKYIIMIPNGETNNARVYGNWEEALVNSKHILAAAMHTQKEPRIVITRYIDTIDSPGMSAVLMNGSVFSLGWNLQSQKETSRHVVAVGTYRPTDPILQKLQKEHEHETAEVFEKFLRKASQFCGIDFDSIEGIANIDLIIPSELEKKFQKKLGREVTFYYVECNPRWTTYTDAVMTVLGAQHKPQTVNNMLQVIREGIEVVDKYKLPHAVDPRRVREFIFKKDLELQKSGTRLICRMTTNPMSVIYTGDIELAQSEMRQIVKSLASETAQTPMKYLFQ